MARVFDRHVDVFGVRVPDYAGFIRVILADRELDRLPDVVLRERDGVELHERGTIPRVGNRFAILDVDFRLCVQGSVGLGLDRLVAAV